MAPAGPSKRVKPNDPNDDTESAHASQDAGMSADTPTGALTPDKQKDSGSNWYTRTWPRKPKAPAVTEVARESISAECAPTPERKRTVTTQSTQSTQFTQSRPVRAPSLGLTKKVGGSTRSLPAEVATTRINIASVGSASVPDIPMSDQKAKETKLNAACSDTVTALPKGSPEVESGSDRKELGHKDVTQDSTPGNKESGKEDQEQPSNQSSGWLAWLALSKNDPEPAPSTVETEQPAEVAATSKPSVEEPAAKEPEPESKGTEQPTVEPEPKPNSTVPDTLSTPKKRSWLQMWGGSSITRQTEDLQRDTRMEEPPDVRNDQSSEGNDDAVNSQPSPTEPQTNQTTEPTNVPTNSARPSSWLFWSKESSKPIEQDVKQPESADSPTKSISRNQASASIKVSEPKAGSAPTEAQPKEPVAEMVVPDTPSKLSSKKAPTLPKDESPSSSVTKILIPNQVLPTFRDTFPIRERPGIIQQISRLLYYTKGTEPPHVTPTPDPPRVKRALAIGVHGYFPAPLIRTVLGQPTGTSLKFSTMAAKAIYSWAESHGSSCEVQKISLEGEGRISERIDLLWKLLLDYIEDIKKADFIMLACHSQGVPVATMLVAKLIAFGCVSSARIGICAMAGVNLGPFPGYRSRWISGSAGELFDFASLSSKVSQDYIAALEVALDFGVRIVYVGSIDDQLVSLEVRPSLSHLVGFAMKLRNLGISDHGLIRELSSPLAGSLYTGDGHSRLYDDESVYQLAVEYTLETSPVPAAKLEINNKSNRCATTTTPNPYILPFAMRGVLEEEYVRRELSEETTELLKLFDDWKPTSKVLKDVKFRLEGIRSKL
ncbi:hypothetical protein FQN53_009501 [Emmonsiellopsis sp. PD_33]|nr:hypothetical protein FQN53_009501 [Emmonsiellopsis sp. PD_33]